MGVRIMGHHFVSKKIEYPKKWLVGVRIPTNSPDSTVFTHCTSCRLSDEICNGQKLLASPSSTQGPLMFEFTIFHVRSFNVTQKLLILTGH